MNRASLPPTLASRLQLRFTRNTQMQPLRRYRSSRLTLCLFEISSPAYSMIRRFLLIGSSANTPNPCSFDFFRRTRGRFNAGAAVASAAADLALFVFVLRTVVLRAGLLRVVGFFIR